MGIVLYLIWHEVLPPYLDLGLDPARFAKVYGWLSLLYVLQALGLFVLLYRVVRTSGRVTLGKGRLDGDVNGTPFSRSLEDVKGIRASIGGRNLRLIFSDTKITLLGLWLPDDWKRGMTRWRSPDGSQRRLRRREHPLIASILRSRPDLRLRTYFPWWVVAVFVISAGEPVIHNAFLFYPQFRALSLIQKKTDAASNLVRLGRYSEACATYRSILPDARHYVYLAQDEAQVQLYCGDLKAAFAAAVGYESTPLWPAPLGLNILPRLRLEQSRFAEAERLLGGAWPGDYLKYLVFEKQGRHVEADAILAEDRRPSGRVGVFNRALLLRHQGRLRESAAEAELIWSSRKGCILTSPSLITMRIYPALLTGDSIKVQAALKEIEPAIRQWPGLRAEVLDFSKRETPEFYEAITRAAQ